MVNRAPDVAVAIDPTLASDLVVEAARLVRTVRRDLDLPAGVRVLSILDEQGPLGVSALAAVDRCSQPTMSAAVAGLLERGWVDKQPHPGDARASLVSLTPAGSVELAEVRRRHGADVAARLARHPDHTPDDLATAVRVLRAVLDPDPGRTP